MSGQCRPREQLSGCWRSRSQGVRARQTRHLSLRPRARVRPTRNVCLFPGARLAPDSCQAEKEGNGACVRTKTHLVGERRVVVCAVFGHGLLLEDGEEPATHRSACMASLGLWRLLPFTVASAPTFLPPRNASASFAAEGGWRDDGCWTNGRGCRWSWRRRGVWHGSGQRRGAHGGFHGRQDGAEHGAAAPAPQ